MTVATFSHPKMSALILFRPVPGGRAAESALVGVMGMLFSASPSRSVNIGVSNNVRVTMVSRRLIDWSKRANITG